MDDWGELDLTSRWVRNLVIGVIKLRRQLEDTEVQRDINAGALDAMCELLGVNDVHDAMKKIREMQRKLG